MGLFRVFIYVYLTLVVHADNMAMNEGPSNGVWCQQSSTPALNTWSFQDSQTGLSLGGVSCTPFTSKIKHGVPLNNPLSLFLLFLLVVPLQPHLHGGVFANKRDRQPFTRATDGSVAIHCAASRLRPSRHCPYSRTPSPKQLTCNSRIISLPI